MNFRTGFLFLRQAGIALLAPILLASCTSSGGSYNLGPTENVAGAVGGLTLEGGVPTGNWVYTDHRSYGTFGATRRSGILLDPEGVGYHAMGYVLDWAPGQVCGNAPFVGQRRVAWVTNQRLKSIKRVGNKIYVYVDESHRAKISTAFPPGHDIATYQALGGTLLGGFQSLLDEVGVSVFEISGKNLILVSAPDKVRRTFVRKEASR